MIVDEADLTLQSLISFDRIYGLLNGLSYLGSTKKVIYMSATVNEYFKNLIKNCFGQYEFKTFASQY